MKNDLNIEGLVAAPGTVCFGRIPVPEAFYADGSQESVPLLVVNGRNDGPLLYLDAATHGSEVGGVEVIQRLARETLNPEEMNGALVCIPAVSTRNFSMCTQFSPHDFLDTNRGYPGNQKGSMVERISYLVFRILKACDYGITFHALSHASVALPFTYRWECPDSHVNARMELMQDAFGITRGYTPWAGGSGTGSLAAVAPVHGVPLILVELPSQYVCGREEIGVGITGTLNVMRAIGILSGKRQPQPECFLIGEKDLRWQGAFLERGGFMRPVAAVGQHVEKGEEIAIMVDVFGNKVAAVNAPAEGYLMAFSASFAQPVRKEGHWVAIVLARNV